MRSRDKKLFAPLLWRLDPVRPHTLEDVSGSSENVENVCDGDGDGDGDALQL